MTWNWWCLNSRFGFSPNRPSAGRRDGWTYATLQCSGPSTRRNVSGCIVPAPISMSRGCWSRQPRVAQNSDSLNMSCCSVTRSCNYICSAQLAQDTGRLQLLVQVQVDQAPVGGFQLPGGAGFERQRAQRLGTAPRRASEELQGVDRHRRPAAGGAPPADVMMLARRHDGAAVVRTAAPRTRGQLRIDALQAHQPE